MKKILVVSGCNPHSIANFESANTAAYYVIRGLAKRGYDVSFLRANFDLPDWPVPALVEKAELADVGVKFLPDLVLFERKAYPSRLRRLIGMMLGDPKVLCRGAQYFDDFIEALGDYQPDIILTVWSEVQTAMVYKSPVPVYAFYGNPDPKSALARIYADIALHKVWRKPRQWMNLVKNIIGLIYFRAAHKKVVRSLAGMANNSFGDTEYYRQMGVANMCHVPVLLEVDRSFEWRPKREELEKPGPLKIIGNAGLLSATGNTIGLEVIATRILPELKTGLGEGNFEIHLFGRDKPLPFLIPLLDDPHIKLRGFAEDLEGEILSAPIFLVANGFHPLFRVGNSRILHGWALGSCMVIFEGTRVAMPEIIDGHNALLGKTPKEIALQIIRAGNDQALRRKLGQNGYETVITLFDPEKVVAKLINNIEIATDDFVLESQVAGQQE